MDESGSKQTTITFFVIICLLIIGFFVALAKGDGTAKPLTSHASGDNTLQTKLTNEFQEHASLLATALRHDYSHYPDGKAIHGQLSQNIQSSGEILALLKNKNVQTQYITLFVAHDQLFFDYTDALKKNDKQAVESSLEAIRQHEELLLTFFLRIDSHLSKTIAADLLSHEDMAMQAMLDSYSMKHYEDSYKKQHDAEMLSSDLATIVTKDISQK